MQLDSHRRRLRNLSITMPCRWSRRCRASVPDPINMDDSEPKIEHWRYSRRSNIMDMRRQVRTIVFFMALMEGIRVGPMQMVFAGKDDFPPRGADDFGISYWVGYFISWIYLCFFSVIFVPIFSVSSTSPLRSILLTCLQWWIPAPAPGSRGHAVLQKTACYLKKLNMILLPLTVGLSMARYIFHLAHIFLYVDSAPADSRKIQVHKRSWLIRAFLLFGIAFTVSFGYYAFSLLEALDLAKVKMTEYLVIVVPIQINLGILIGTIFQFRMEKRIAQRKARKAAAAKIEEGEVHEKQALLDA